MTLSALMTLWDCEGISAPFLSPIFSLTLPLYYPKPTRPYRKRLSVPLAPWFIQAKLLASSRASAAEPVHGAGWGTLFFL